MPNIPEAPVPVDSLGDPRLGRAGELAAYLRDNQRETRRDPEELAKQFGLDPAVVAQIQSSAFLRARKAKPAQARADYIGVVKRLGERLAHLVAKGVERPYAYQTVVALLTLAVALTPGIVGSAAVGVWVVAQVGCLLAKPQFRIVAFSSLTLWIVSGIAFTREFLKQPMPTPWNTIDGVCLLGFILGMTMGMLNVLCGSAFVVLSGSLQIATRRRREASLSRQDLLSRMFWLQEQLETLPARVEKRPNAVVTFARKRLFLTSLVGMFLLVLLISLTTIGYHVDPTHVQQTTHTYPQRSSGNVQISSLNVPSGYLFFSTAISLVRIVLMVSYGLIATTWRRVAHAWAGMTLGGAVAILATWPFGGLGTAGFGATIAAASSGSVTAAIFLLIVRFAVGFNRSLQRYRAGDRPDEAAIVSELLEIRQRLSANPVQVCVLVADAAGSTQMKRHADPLMVEYSFGRYQHWLGEIVAQNGGKVEIRTGDGAICAFGEAEKALAAANALQSGVGEFNASQNRLEQPFRLRIALHSGAVEADLDKVQFTEVIDVAAHVEKYSPVGGIALTAPFVGALADLPGLSAAATVDGVEVFTLAAG